MSKRKVIEEVSEDAGEMIIEEANESPEETPEEVPDETVTEEVSEDVSGHSNGYKTYKSLSQGVVSIPLIVQDKFGNDVKRYVRFDKHTLRTNDPQEIEGIEKIYDEDKNLPIKNRRVLTEDEFISLTSPESLYVEVDGAKIHISQIREAVKIAKENGWTPSETDVVIINESKSKIIRGGTSAGIGGI